MKMKAKIGAGYQVTRTELKKRMSDCAKLATLVERARCSLDRTGDLIEAGARGQGAITKGLKDAHEVALTIKNEFWMPDDKTPYTIEKATKELIGKVTKAGKHGKIDDKTAARLTKSMKTLAPKLADIWDKRAHWHCTVRDYEEIEPGK